MKKFSHFFIAVFAAFFITAFIAGCSSSSTSTNESGQENAEGTETNGSDNAQQNNEDSEEGYEALQGKLEVDPVSGPVLTEVEIHATGLDPNEEAKIVWHTKEGKYELKNIYQFVRAAYEDKLVELGTATTDENGELITKVTIPEGFGGDHDIGIYQNDKLMAKANFFVKTTFTIDSERGPVGSWITITGKGLGWKDYGSIWHVNYDNRYTGMITAISTNGTAVAKFRAAGPVGPHTITVESGAHGMPYINRQQSPHSYLETHRFSYYVTDENPGELTYVTDVPEQAANGGAELPEPQNAEGVTVEIDKEMGVVGEEVTITASGLPANSEATFIWHTMVGNRVSGQGFSETTNELGKATTDANGNLEFKFPAPDDLGGPPHLIDIVINDKVMGQTYFKIIPSIVKIEPQSGPVGTEIEIEVKGVGWTEYDNIYNIVYDNAYIGYVCGFNSQGTVNFKIEASGTPGYHIIDLYPGIYKGENNFPEIFKRPQLTYEKDHPGSRIPSIHFGFKVTE